VLPPDTVKVSFDTNQAQSTLDFPQARPKLVAAMARLAQLLANHGSILVLDAASQRVQVGLLQAGEPALWAAMPDEAGRGVFVGTEQVSRQSGCGINAIGAFLFCEGPGSMLGTRTVAMALRTWLVLKSRPVYSYQSLALAARFAWSQQTGRACTIIADARRETWHCQTIRADGATPPLQRLPATELPAASCSRRKTSAPGLNHPGRPRRAATTSQSFCPRS